MNNNKKKNGSTPEQRLLKLLEEGISMGKFNAVKAQEEVWEQKHIWNQKT